MGKRLEHFAYYSGGVMVGAVAGLMFYITPNRPTFCIGLALYLVGALTIPGNSRAR